MTSRKLILVGMMIALVVLPSIAAQGGGSRSPSTSGGTSGGPGMSGAAVNTGGGTANRGGGTANEGGGAPNAGGGGAPSTGGGGAPNAGGGGAPSTGGGGAPSMGGGGTRPGGGGAPNAGGGGAPGTGGGGGQPTPGGTTPGGQGGAGQAPGGMNSGGGFAPFSGQGEGVEGRFGGRSAESFSLDSFLGESGFSSFEELSTEAFQDQAGTASTAGQTAADEATAQAQGAYDQIWSDYYTAVDSTAQTYYDTTTASADYALQTYEEAVTYTAQTVDSYTTYSDEYAAYCAEYSWDCYSYTYDDTTGSYTYTGDTSSTATTTVNIGDVTVTGAYPAVSAPESSAEAYEALVVFANDQLGAAIEPLYAGAYTGDLAAIMAYLPAEMQAYVQNVVALSSATYWGLWQGGGGAVMVGDCTNNPSACTVSADTLSVQLSSASAGVYGLLTSVAMPTTPDGALQLITEVYPKFTGLAFAQVTDIDTGYAFTATTASMGLDPATQQPVSVAKVIYAGVVSINGQAYVYALVGVGEGYASALS